MTTNIPLPAADGREGEERRIMAELRKFFRPEFLNRIDEVIPFHPLSRETLGRIVDLQVARVEKTLADRKVTLSVSPEARDYLARIGFDPDFGARPLKRAIQRTILDPLALELLKGTVRQGDRIEVAMDARGQGVVFQRAA